MTYNPEYVETDGREYLQDKLAQQIFERAFDELDDSEKTEVNKEIDEGEVAIYDV